MLRLASLALVLSACPASPPPPPPRADPPPAPAPTEPPPAPSGSPALASTDACTTDADCEITTFSGCCACPGCDQTSVRSKPELAAAQQMCHAIRCDMERCKSMLCKAAEPIERFAAACQNNVCVGVRR